VKQFDQRCGIVRWHAVKHKGVQQAEDGGVRADAEGQWNHSNSGKSGISAQRTQAEAHILPEGFHKRFPAGGADDFLRSFQVAAFQAHGPKRLLTAHPLVHLFFDSYPPEAMKFFIQFLVDTFLTEQ